MSSLSDMLYALNAVLMLVIAVTSFRYWLRLPEKRGRLSLAILAISLITLSDGARYWWFAAYRIIESPPWMLDHWFVVGFTLVGTIAALIYMKLYAPVGLLGTLTIASCAVAAVLYLFMP